MSTPINVLITTRNEARHIAAAVTNASALGKVFVVDSGSTDDTQALAADAGAVVVEHAFVTYARQKNWALENLPFDAQWVLILDADERLTDGLKEEVQAIAARSAQATQTGAGQLPAPSPPPVGYYVNRIMLFMGRGIRHGGLYPSWNLRFFQRGKCRYEDRSVHEHMIAQGPVGYLRNRMLHVKLETISEYIQKHIHYADLESDEWVRTRLGKSTTPPASKLFPSVLGVRQHIRRQVWPRIPCRPVWRFLYMYFVRLGFLDGKAGFHLAVLMGNYEHMIGILCRDKLRRARANAAITPD